PKDPAVGTKSWQQSNKKLNIRLDTPNPHVSNPDGFRGENLDCFAALAMTGREFCSPYKKLCGSTSTSSF
ncbi:hypothetical protein, partial [Bradyrhizobium sp. 132]|uniref:hypothetical protein n=1 Tax=Bradyrhizobium sp. 132 TaxID=2782610 RepID=UPI001FF84552